MVAATVIQRKPLPIEYYIIPRAPVDFLTDRHIFAPSLLSFSPCLSLGVPSIVRVSLVELILNAIILAWFHCLKKRQTTV
jgi:hypothetical protein